MAVTKVGSSSSGDAGSPNTSYNWLHSCHADTNLLVVLARGRDATQGDFLVDDITYGGNSLTYVYRYWEDTTDQSVEVWYYPNPTVSSSLSIVVSHTGKVSDAAGAAVDLAGADADGTPVDDYGYTYVAAAASQSNTLTINPAATGSMLVSGY